MSQFTPAYLFVRDLPDLEDPDLRELLADTADAMEEVLSGHQGALMALAENAHLTDEGKKVARRELSQKTAGSLVTVKAVLDRLEAAVKQSEADLLNPHVRRRVPDGIDPDDARQMESESRTLLRELDHLDVEALYMAAAQDGDTITVRAIELAPPAFPLVGEAALEKGARAFAQQADPDGYALLQQQQAVLTSLRGDLNRLVADMYGNSPPVRVEGAEDPPEEGPEGAQEPAEPAGVAG